ncbi:Rdx family protein [Sulfurospirillum oryzae]|uniref:Rdx family protein n=1 Tax=Sulfurospirillum oryzae TaxID=2976535 RepID=UPI0021E789AB|nr:Rdx family protein [Sulfurospirillum oryzae]
MPRAFRVKDEILSAYPNAKTTLSPKTGGFFDVVVDDIVIFSKTEKIGTPIERFPEVGEIAALLKKAGY